MMHCHYEYTPDRITITGNNCWVDTFVTDDFGNLYSVPTGFPFGYRYCDDTRQPF